MTNHPLPTSWLEASLGDLLQFNYGKSLPERVRSGHGFPVYGSNGVVGYHDNAISNGETLIIGRKGSAGEISYSLGPCFPIDTTYYIDEFYGMPSKYWFHVLKYLNLGDLNRATAIPGLNRDDAYRILSPVPPLNEQKRIADKLDSLLARVNTCRERLNRVLLILAQFRQSVLAAATSGMLTEDWRAVNKQGKWQHMNLGNVCRSITDGDHQAPPKTEIGIPFITISDVNDGRLKLDRATRFVSHDYFENLKPTRKPQQGDVLFTVTGSIAIPVLVNTNAPFTFQRHIAILKPDRIKVYSNYLAYALSSNNVKSQANSVASGIAQLTIPLAKLHAIEISVPSLEEQDEVVRRVEALFSYAEQVESRCQVALAHVEQLTQALLAKAFRGELVPQDPNDEPASVLLERARTLRELQPIKPKRVLPRKPNMIKITEASVKKAVRQLPSDTFSFDELRESIPGDYETLKEVVFALLEEPEPGFTQIFDQEVQAIRFVQRHT